LAAAGDGSRGLRHAGRPVRTGRLFGRRREWSGLAVRTTDPWKRGGDSRMRSEQEMKRLIMDFAERDARVRAVVLNGSRTDPQAPRDMFQDWDIIYAVTEVEPYVQDRSWMAAFGELMIMQTPDDMALFPQAEGAVD